MTKHEHPWTSKTGSPVSTEFGRLLKHCSLTRDGLNFYALRHTFQTVADGSPQSPGHECHHGPRPQGRRHSAVYREEIQDDRLQAIVDHVHQWLFKDEGDGKSRDGTRGPKAQG